MEKEILEQLELLNHNLNTLIDKMPKRDEINETDDLMTAKELAEYFHISYWGVSKLIREGLVPVVKKVRPYRVSKKDFIQYMKRNAKKN